MPRLAKLISHTMRMCEFTNKMVHCFCLLFIQHIHCSLVASPVKLDARTSIDVIFISKMVGTINVACYPDHRRTITKI